MEVPLAEDRTMAESINGSMATCTDISLSHGLRGGETEREREGVSLRKMLPFDLSEVQLKHYMNTLKGRNEIEKKKWG